MVHFTAHYIQCTCGAISLKAIPLNARRRGGRSWYSSALHLWASTNRMAKILFSFTEFFCPVLFLLGCWDWVAFWRIVLICVTSCMDMCVLRHRDWVIRFDEAIQFCLLSLSLAQRKESVNAYRDAFEWMSLIQFIVFSKYLTGRVTSLSNFWKHPTRGNNQC